MNKARVVGGGTREWNATTVTEKQTKPNQKIASTNRPTEKMNERINKQTNQQKKVNLVKIVWADRRTSAEKKIFSRPHLSYLSCSVFEFVMYLFFALNFECFSF